MKIRNLVLAQLVWMIPAQFQGQISIPKVLTDHMVLQRGAPIHIWGQASPNDVVKVSMEADTVTGTADQYGRWSVYLPARSAGGPYKLSIRGTNTIELSDILVGDVWVASGQSNMEMPLAGFPNSAVVKDSAQEISNAGHPEIRLLRVKKMSSLYPLDDVKIAVGWQACTPETAKDFSAIGYFFGRDISMQEQVPIGVIESSWGGTPAEAWVSQDGLSQGSALKSVWETRAADMNQEESILLQRALDAKALAQGKTVPKRQSDTVDGWNPSAIYNAMIAPLLGLRIRGVIWYQGESNTDHGRSRAYEEVFGTLIQDWRKKWQIGDFPFLYVQLASFNGGSGWPIVREAQRRTLSLSHTGMAVAIDVGEEKQVHPAQKQIVGERLALLARSVAYGEHVISNGPLFRQAVPMAGAMRVLFDSADGLTSKGGTLGGFEVAGENEIFAPASASIENDTVIVQSSSVPHPIYVRYAWKGFPKDANLYNRADLPAAPFTSQRAYANPQPNP